MPITDVQADINMAYDVLGYPNSYFESIYAQIGTGWDWNYCCSEIACCISYMAGNLDKIYVSSYAQGLVNLYQMHGRFGHTPSPGAFIWFDYGDGNGPSHTGRVVAVDGNLVTTIEGNTNGGYVNMFYYDVNNPWIYGYGYPDYTDEPMPDPPTPPGPFPPEPAGKRKMKLWMYLKRIPF